VSRVSDVRIGLLGLGTVGAGVVKILQTRRAMLEERAGARLTLAAIADTDLTRAREGLDLKSLPLTGDAAQVLTAPAIHIVIELVGGLEPARTFIQRALTAGKHVVTANKALLAHHGAELYEEARRAGVSLGFEAAVAGGIPLIRAVKEGLVANRVLSLAGIVNGTCNYILSKMTDEGLDFSLVLKEAQAHGYAEADPTLDIEGMDSAHKLQILVALAFRGHHPRHRAGHRVRAGARLPDQAPGDRQGDRPGRGRRQRCGSPGASDDDPGRVAAGGGVRRLQRHLPDRRCRG